MCFVNLQKAYGQAAWGTLWVVLGSLGYQGNSNIFILEKCISNGSPRLPLDYDILLWYSWTGYQGRANIRRLPSMENTFTSLLSRNNMVLLTSSHTMSAECEAALIIVRCFGIWLGCLLSTSILNDYISKLARECLMSPPGGAWKNISLERDVWNNLLSWSHPR